ncbi:hypothetical protein P3102_13940 [Amycolatopsis sp. QT-25]|uniref:hypothetical protein n=1 Tax=Amycolatopsis sp. QT-25 TaxID=3034022 RepID=UPI0023EAE44F|nr:hypothetical protein [Amycolatopsis sp. QT-25]WET82215.1 hypothetical protein P3102_13940 [Amycolatopsis sp. QT-25]
MNHERMLAPARSYIRVHKALFPGGLVPSTTSVEQGTPAGTGLKPEDARESGQDHTRTFHPAVGRKYRLDFDDVFKRMQEFCPAYSEAGFRSGYLEVHQFGFAENGR